MGRDSAIEWTHHTFNPWRGCTKVSPGCAHCYAEKQSLRNPKVLGIWGDDGTRVVAAESYWNQPFAWDRDAKQAGERHRVFCLSLGDWLEKRPDLVHPRMRLCATIDGTPNLDWLLLSKRPENCLELIPEGWRRKLPDNVWLGFSAERQKEFDERWRHMEAIEDELRPRVIFVSAEPLLGDIRLPESFLLPKFAADDDRYTGKWVIVGGESGGSARPMYPDWPRHLRDQCRDNGVPFFFKQWGEWAPVRSKGTHFVCERGHYDEFNADRLTKHVDGDACTASYVTIARPGKEAAGRDLDGRKWSEFPSLAPVTPAVSPFNAANRRG